MADNNTIQQFNIKATADVQSAIKNLESLKASMQSVDKGMSMASATQSLKQFEGELSTMARDIKSRAQEMAKSMSPAELRQAINQNRRTMNSAQSQMTAYGDSMGQMWRNAKTDFTRADTQFQVYQNRLDELSKSSGTIQTKFEGVFDSDKLKGEIYGGGKEMLLDMGSRDYASEIDKFISKAQYVSPTIEKTTTALGTLKFWTRKAFQPENLQKFANKMSVVSEKAGTISDKMGKVGGFVGNLGKRFLSAINPMRLFNKEQSKTALASSFLGKAFSRLARMFRIMVTRMLIRAFISNIREGFQNIAQYSEEVNRAFSSIGASAKTLYNSVASAFAPLVQAIAPYIVKFLDMITSAFNKVAELISAITGKSYYIKATKFNYDYAKSLDKSTKATNKNTKAIDKNRKKKKELKSETIGIVRLNVIAPDKDKANNGNNGSGSGAGGGVNPNDMFDTKPVSKKMKDLAKKVKQIASKLFNPLQQAWNKKGAKVLGSFKRMLGSIWKTVKDIGRDFLTMWAQPETEKIFEDILDTVATIFDIVTAISDQFRKAWNKDNVGLHIFENLRDVVGIIVKRIKKCAEYTRDWAKNLNFSPLLQSIERYTKSLKKLVKGLSDIAGDFYETVVLGISKWVVEKGLPNLIQVFTDFNNKVDWQSLRKSLKVVWEGVEKFGEAVGQGLIDFIHWLADGIADLLNSSWFKGFLEGIGKALKSIKPEQVTIALKTFVKVLLTLKTVQFVGGVLGKVAMGIGKVKGALGNLKGAIGSGGISGALGIGGLTVALVYLADIVSDIQRAKNQTRYLSDEEDKYLTKLEEEQSLHQSNLDATKRQNQNVLDLSGKATGYKKNLDDIVDKNGKIKKGYEGQAKYLVGELNQALGTNMKVIDGQVEGYKRGTKQLKKQLSLVAQKQILEQGATQYYDNQGVLEKGTKDLNKVKGTIEKLSGTNLKEALQTVTGGAGGSANVFNTLTSAINYYKNDKDLQKALKTYKSQLKDIRESYRYNIRYEALQNAKGKKEREKALKNMSKSLTKQEKATFNTISNVALKYNKSIPELITKNKSFDKAIKEAGLKGKNISQKLREGFLSGKISTDNIIEYQKLYEQAKKKSPKIAKEIANGIKGNKQSVKDAIGKLQNVINGVKGKTATIKAEKGKNFDKNVDNASDKIKSSIPSTVEILIKAKLDKVSVSKAGKESNVIAKMISKGYSLNRRSQGAGGHTYGYFEKDGKTKRVRLYASGGYPKLGSEFIAGEAGAELVGTINGKTGVASNQEITGIRDSIEETSNAQIQMLQEQNNLLRGILAKDYDLNLDGEKITKKVNKINARSGYRIATT